MLPVTVTLHVPYAENEQQFLRQAVEAAVRTFRSLNPNPGHGIGEVSSTGTTQEEPTPQLVFVA